VKNLTLEQNIQNIQQNSIDHYQQLLGQPYFNSQTHRPEDYIVTPDVLSTLFNDVARRVRQELGEDSKIHVYGLTMPVGRVVSDYGDVIQNVMVEEVPYGTLEGIRNHIINELLDDKEVYIYTILMYKIYDPMFMETQNRYTLRSKSIPRSSWAELIQDVEQAISPWTINGNTITYTEYASGPVEPPTTDLVQKGKLKKHKF
jgi:hypothetical protein